MKMSKFKLYLLLLLFVVNIHQIFSIRDCNSIENPTEQRLCMIAVRAMESKDEDEQNELALTNICKDCGNCAPDVNDEQGEGCIQKCSTIYDFRPTKKYTCADANENKESCTSPCLGDNHVDWCIQEEKWSVCYGPAAGGCAWFEGLAKPICEEGEDGYTGYTCMDLNCLQNVFNELLKIHQRKTLKKALRKEYRLLSDSERERFHRALNELKRKGIYDKFVVQHYENAGYKQAAHYGPAFLPWHREYIKRMEISLRTIDPDISLPYWDFGLEARLQNPRDSVLWSAELMGGTNAQGELITGPFRDWSVDIFMKNAFDPVLRRPTKHIIRKLGGAQNNMRLPNDQQIAALLNQPYFDLFLASNSDAGGNFPKCQLDYYNRTIEHIHGWVHQHVGGHLSETELSSNDPIFFLLHSYVDYLWEYWRTFTQSPAERESVYPSNFRSCAIALHQRTRDMLPFGITNGDGLSNNYTANLYEYQFRPACSYESADCGSKYLFCDYSHGLPQCVSKLRYGSNCFGYFYDEDVCYKSRCYNNYCH